VIVPAWTIIVTLESGTATNYTCVADDSWQAFDKAKIVYPTWKSLKLLDSAPPELEYDTDFQ
jgi:hypothetical protein